MFLAVRIGAPRNAVRTGSSVPAAGRSAGFGGSAGRPPPLPVLFGRDWLGSGRRSTLEAAWAAVVGRAGADWVGGGSVGPAAAGGGCVAAGAGAETLPGPFPAARGVGVCCGVCLGACFGAGVCCWPRAAVSSAAGRPLFCSVKKRTQLGSTDVGSAVYCSYI